MKIQPAMNIMKRDILSQKAAQKKLSNVVETVKSSVLDLSGEENGYFKFGSRLVKMVFPR